ncbi:uncharacterized protein LOC144150936 isoform X2 [Haemaphysalis longicornis]
MKKHLQVLLALVAFVGLVNGLGGGASGGAGGSAKKSGGLEATAPKNSTAVSLNGKGGSAPSGNRSITGGTTSVLGGGAGGGTGGGASRSRSGSTGGATGGSASGGTRPSVGGSASGGAGQATARQTSGTGASVTADADSESGGGNPPQASSIRRVGGVGGGSAAAGGGASEAQRDRSSRSPGSSAPTTGPSSTGSSGAERLSRGPGAGRPAGRGNVNRSGPRGGIPEPGPFDSGSSTEVGRPVRGFHLSLGGAGGGLGASADESGRLDSGLFSAGQSFGDPERGIPGFGAFGGASRGYSGSPFSDPYNGGVGGAAAGRTGGRGGLGNEDLFEDEPGFSSAFGASGFPRNHETGFPTSGISNRGSGLGGDFGAGSFGTDRNGGEGGFGGSAFGFGGFSSGSNGGFGSPGGDTTEFGLPEGPNGTPGPSGENGVGENGPLPGLFTQQGPRPLAGSDNGPVGPSGWPTRENVNNFANSGLDSSRDLSSPAANGPVGPVRSGLLHSLWQRRREGQGLLGLGSRLRRPDPRLAAAIAAGTLVGATALGGLGAGIAAAIIASRARDAAGSGGRRRRCRARERRINMGLKAAQEIFNRMPVHLERRY